MNKKQSKPQFTKVLMLSAVLSATFSGCATSQNVRQINENASQTVNQRVEAARQTTVPSSTFVVNNGFYAARAPIQAPEFNRQVRLPSEFQKDASLSRLTPTSLTEISSHITRMSGYRVVISPDVASEASSTLPEVLFKGNLSGLLDYISGSINVSWRWTGDRIEIYRFETKMFRINALAGTTDVSTTLDTTSTSSMSKSSVGGAGNAGNEGESGQKTQIDSQFNIWEDITAAVKGVLSSGGTMTVAPSAGLITVRDTPLNLAQVEAQVREFNRVYSRQVMMNVEVYAVERSESDTKATDWTVAWTEAAQKFGLGFSSGGAGNTANAAAPSFSGVINSGPFSGSGAMFQALNSLGRATLVTSGTISSLNGQSVPLNVSREQAYLQSYSTTLTSGDAGNSTTTLTPGVVTDGFSMHFTPRILEDNKVMMRYSVDLSSTDAIVTFEAPDGNSAIQLPRRSVRNFMQNVSMRSGQTLVLTGFQQSNANADSSGPFSSKAWMFGGAKKMESLSRTIVIVVTPQVVE